MPIPHISPSQSKKKEGEEKKKATAKTSQEKFDDAQVKEKTTTTAGATKQKKKGSVQKNVVTPGAWKGLNRKERKEKLKKELGNAASRKEKRKIKKAAHKAKPWYKRLVSWRVIWRLGLVLCIFGVIAGTAAGIGLYMWVAKDLASIEDIEHRKVDKTTKIYASDGTTLLYEVGDNKRVDTTLDNIDDDIEHALISIEDKRFYDHGAVDLRGISRAVWRNAVNKSATGEGASTLTQQFARNVALSNERTYSRKLKEIILSERLEHKYGKDKILEMYLNNIYFGANIQGVEAASQEYFGKSAADVSLAEAATLASLPQNPVILTNDPAALKYRKNTTLDIMVAEGYITQEEADSAKAEKVKVVENLDDTLSMVAPHFANYVNGILEEQFGQNTVRNGGLKVITTLDVSDQKIAKEVIADHIADVESYGGSNAALVHIDPKTGFIKAMVGSRDFSDTEHDGQVNVATSLRQPGSSLKPFAYLLAFSKGYTPETKLWDVETDFLPVAADGSISGGDTYRPRNYSLTQSGPVTLRHALSNSLNIPAVKILYLAGLPDFFDELQKFGYTSFNDRDRYGLSIVLGGGEVNLLEHTNAYATLAAEGQHRDHVSIQEIRDEDGNVIYKWEDKPKEVMDANSVRMLTSVLSDVAARGYTFAALNLADGRPFAAKTGTTDDHRDAWTMGYTPSLAVGVWAGNNNNSAMGENGAGVYVAAPIVNDYVSRITEGDKIEEFTPPEYSAANDVLAGNLYAGETDVRVDKITGKRIPDDCTTYPEEYIEVKSERTGHSILYYLDKNNPTVLSSISNPGNDPMFENWEKAISGHKDDSENEEDNEKTDEISDEYMSCDARNEEESEPEALLYINDGGEYSAETLRLYADVTAIGDTTVQFFIDGNLVDAQQISIGDQQATAPVEARYTPDALTSGAHTISILITDAIGHTAESSASIVYNSGNNDNHQEDIPQKNTNQRIDDDDILNEVRGREDSNKNSTQ